MKCSCQFRRLRADGPVDNTRRGQVDAKALPLGEFVKIVGMTSMDDVDPEDEPHSFRHPSEWRCQPRISPCAHERVSVLIGRDRRHTDHRTRSAPPDDPIRVSHGVPSVDHSAFSAAA